MSFLSRLRVGALLLISLAACEKNSPDPITPPTPPVAQPVVYSTVQTVAGNGMYGFADGVGTSARFALPNALTVDTQGNLYVADGENGRIRRITPAGVVSTFAGNDNRTLVNGLATNASFHTPLDITIDKQGNLYVASDKCIRKITPAGMVSTFAGTGKSGYVDGPIASAEFSVIYGITLDAQGVMYVADAGNRCIRKITPTGIVSTLAGDGTWGRTDGEGSKAQFRTPEGLAVDAKGNLYVTDAALIRKITPEGVVTTLAGDLPGYANGESSVARFYVPSKITFDAQGNLYIADFGNNCIRKMTPAGIVSTLTGTQKKGNADGPLATAQFDNPCGIVIDAKGILYIAEYGGRIRKIIGE